MPRPKDQQEFQKKAKLKASESSENIQFSLQDNEQPQPEVKKRGRKPKGGKLITKKQMKIIMFSTTNVILHLKCSLKDIENDGTNLIGDPMNYNSSVPPTIKAYDHTNENNFFELKNKSDVNETNAYNESVNKIEKDFNIPNQQEEDVNIKDINYKLKQLKVNLYKNLMDEKKSACFWCNI